MNRLITSIGLLLTFILVNICSSLSAEGSIEARIGAFAPSSKIVKDLYGNALPCYQLEASALFRGNFDGWLNFDYVNGTSERTVCDGHSGLNIYTLSFGLQYNTYLTPKIKYYLGLGPAFAYINLRELCFRGDIARGSIGGRFKGGFAYDFLCNLFGDLFVEYIYQPVKFENIRNIGGFRVGLGLGYYF